MKYRYKFWVVLVFISLGILKAQAQKIEVEKRISSEEFPGPALDYLAQHFPEAKRSKFYQETSKDGTTYEIKLRSGGFRYSVEFFPDGTLMDIEKEIKFSSIPPETRALMQDQWEKDFKKFKVKRCQEQTSVRGVRYEIEVKGTTKQSPALHEYLFEQNGHFVKADRILLRPSDMTLY